MRKIPQFASMDGTTPNAASGISLLLEGGMDDMLIAAQEATRLFVLMLDMFSRTIMMKILLVFRVASR
jgi:hypothetical protein